MPLIQCPTCRARRPQTMPSCPVCDGRCGTGPALLTSEEREKAEFNKSLGPVFGNGYVQFFLYLVLDLLASML